MGYRAGVALPINMARLRVGLKSESIGVTAQDQAATIRFELDRGKTELEGLLLGEDNKPICGALFLRAANQMTAATSLDADINAAPSNSKQAARNNQMSGDHPD